METDILWEKVFPEFRPSEFDAPFQPDSGRLLCPRTLYALYRARLIIGLPFKITRNGGIAYDGHSAESRHYLQFGGDAADFYVVGDVHFQDVLKVLQEVGFRGIGCYPQWSPKAGFHVDMREQKLMWIRVGKEYHYFH